MQRFTPLLAILLCACFDKPDTGDDAAGWEGQVAGECDDGADNDGDGWWDCDDPDCAHAPECELTDDDADGYDSDVDCDDQEPDVHPGADELCDGLDNDCDGAIDDDDPDVQGQGSWHTDGDGDGYGDPASAVLACEAPSGWIADDGDCDDNDPGTHPGAEERCDAADNDCDDEVDEDAVDMLDWYPDVDEDGYGDVEAVATSACAQPSGLVGDASDCDDRDPGVHPEADEVCDAVDNDCDGNVDEDDAADAGAWYTDNDGDGYGDEATLTLACEAPSGSVAIAGDCDDRDDEVSPDAVELCDGEDNDCDGTVDEDDAADVSTWYADADADGYGDPLVTASACTQPSGFVSPASPDMHDCDDDDASINPGATETCDGVDQDCDGVEDEGAADAGTWHSDADADGYGSVSDTLTACEAPSGYLADDSDCDDSDASINPGATETPADGVDSDCDGAELCWDDDDGDGYLDTSGDTRASVDSDCSDPNEGDAGTPTTDCDDDDATIHPGATETPADGVDSDCDGAELCWDDDDGDGYLDTSGDTRASVDSDCSDANEGDASTPTTDCDDDDASAYPGAPETCDGVDDDCDGVVDDGATGSAIWYEDGDGDDYGDSSSSISTCTPPSGWVADSTDCDDSDATIYPGAVETVADGVDQSCDGLELCYQDGDLDGYHAGDTVYSVDLVCDAPGEADASAPSGDCDDSDASANPGATEDPTDGVDNDCDGEVDEGSLAVVCSDGTASYTSIQDAIDDASEGDLITICSGTYEEALEISGIELSLEGLGGAAGVLIDGGSSTALTIDSTAVVSISGLTLSGYRNSSVNGAAIDCLDATIDATDIIVTGSVNDSYGSAVCLDACESSFVDVAFEDNDARWIIYAKNGGSLSFSHNVVRDNGYPATAGIGALMAVSDVDAVVNNNLFIDNETMLSSSGALKFSSNSASAWVYNNTIHGNSNNGSSNTYVIEGLYGGTDIQNNIVADNTGYTYGYYVYAGPNLEYNDSFGGAYSYHCSGGCAVSSTNIQQDPRFEDASAWDFTLDPGFSPCVDAGNPLAGYDDPDGSRNDMGAFGGAEGDWDPPLFSYFLDADGDGWGSDDDTLRGSSAPSGYVEEGGDCDDSDSAIHPGATELADGLDNECDGVIDDICSCDVCDDGGSPYASLQDAIDDTSSGGTVTVCGGTWSENIAISGKEIAILGSDAETTIIDGGSGPALNLSSSALVEISDLTLTGTAGSSSEGAAVTCADASLSANDIIVRDSSVDSSGYIFRLYPCDVVIDGMLMEDNSASILLYAAAGSLELSHAEITGNTGRLFNISADSLVFNNLFWGNTDGTGSSAGYFASSAGSSHWVFNNTFADNTGTGSNFLEIYGSSSEFYNNIVADNTGWGTGVYGSSSPAIDYNDSYGHSVNLVCSGCTLGSNNLQQNARFTDAGSGDYSLDTSFSPCVDAGNPLSGYDDPDGTQNDMGAYGGPYGSW